MKKRIVSYSLLIGVLLMFSGLSYARTDGDVKSSPLFQASLEETVGSMDANSSPGQGVEVAMATQGQYCGIPTFSPTCEPTICSEPSCTMTTYYTVCSTTCRNTCATCYNTCSSTCTNTCTPGACQRYQFSGYAYWYCYGYAGSNYGLLPSYFDVLVQTNFVYTHYSDNQDRGKWTPNGGSSRYSGSDLRTTLAGGSYYMWGGGWCTYYSRPGYYQWSSYGDTGAWYSLQLVNNDKNFFINVTPH